MTDPPRHWRPFRPITRGAARAFTILSILTFLLAGASYWLSVRAVQAEISNRATVVQLCQSGNDFRAQQLILWNHLIAVSVPPPRETAAQQRQRARTIAAVAAYVRKVFAPRDCRFSGK